MAHGKRFAYTALIAASLGTAAWGCSSDPPQAPPDAPTTIPETSVDLPKDADVSPTASTSKTQPAAVGSGS